MIGLFTRLFAAALAIEMPIALMVAHLSKGYSAGAGGYEYVLLIGVVLFAIAIRGGGPYRSTPRLARNFNKTARRARTWSAALRIPALPAGLGATTYKPIYISLNL